MISKNQTKFIKSLKIKKYRAKEKCFLVEGKKNVTELINSDFGIRSIIATEAFISDNRKMLEPYRNVLYEASADEIADLGTFKTNHECLAVAQMKGLSIDTITMNETIIALDGVSDPGNLGTIIRTMDWFGFRQLICSRETAEFYNPKVINSTMGSFTRVTVVYTDIADFIQRSAMPAYGATLSGADLEEWKPAGAVILVMGSESHGLSGKVSARLKGKISIARTGTAESLNVAIATGIFCHHLKRL